jgi:hypothetical protein
MKNFTLFISLAFLASCTTLKYQDDLGFLVSAQAESPEFPVYFNSKLCRDTDLVPGLCSKRIRSTDTLKIELPGRSYGYRLDLTCSQALGESQSFNVQAGKSFTHEITPDKFAKLKSFICMGEVFPTDRPQPMSAQWEVRVKVVDAAYTPREAAYITHDKGKTYLVLGSHAREAWVWDEGAWRHYDKTTVVEIKGDEHAVAAYSESYQMRFNAYGLNNDAARSLLVAAKEMGAK